MNEFIFETKARNLVKLKDRLATASVLPVFFFKVSEWRREPSFILKKLGDNFTSGKLIVRSSSSNEDKLDQSLAGQFLSILNVEMDGINFSDLQTSIERVIKSYGDSLSSKDEILVQPMLKDVVLSGVVFSVDPSTGSPYKVINFTEGDNTSIVTGGTKGTKTFVSINSKIIKKPSLKKVVRLVEELEKICGNKPLDIEFGLDRYEELFLFQVRPLKVNKPIGSAKQLKKRLNRISDKIKRDLKASEDVLGFKNVYSIMTDWNPAEIIGVRPRPLSLSLYKNLITDSTWAFQRDNYGYRKLRSCPLLVNFSGLPYIDTRVSFNSFIPKGLDENISEKLINYYLKRLIDNPWLHDKVEFEIIFSCYSFDLEEKISSLKEENFSEEETEKIILSLRDLTNEVISGKNGHWKKDVKKLEILEKRRVSLLEKDIDEISKIYWLLEDCKRYGTLPFAGLARAGFIAVKMLKSLVSIKVFSEHDYNCFMQGLNTISSEYTNDLHEMKKNDFLIKYGHLRPGTYDIRSKRYDEEPDLYLKKSRDETGSKNETSFQLSIVRLKEIEGLLNKHGIAVDVIKFFDFLKSSIEYRELAKFRFTRNLSDALMLLKNWGIKNGFDADQLSYANIDCISKLYASSDDPKQLISESIKQGKKNYEETLMTWLPPIIVNESDIWSFSLGDSEPNYVTQKSVEAEVATVDPDSDLQNKIVLIEAADPGFDWLFTHNISGLITAYGGINSHMAIRASEYGLPAVIGAGQELFNKWAMSKVLRIDCQMKKVEIIR